MVLWGGVVASEGDGCGGRGRGGGVMGGGALTVFRFFTQTAISRFLKEP